MKQLLLLLLLVSLLLRRTILKILVVVLILRFIAPSDLKPTQSPERNPEPRKPHKT